MKNLFVSFFLSVVSFVSFSQTYNFDVKSYDLYISMGFSEKDTVLKKSKMSVPMVCNRKYTLDLSEKTLHFYEDGVFVEKFKVIDVIEINNETEVIVESWLTNNSDITTFSIYLTLKKEEVSDICLYWFDPFNNRTLVKKVN
jgi:hypothetical protein